MPQTLAAAARPCPHQPRCASSARQRLRWRRETLAAAALFFVLLPGCAASAHTTIVAGDAQEGARWQGWVDASLLPTADTSVRVTGTACLLLQAAACTMTDQHPMVTYFPAVSYLFSGPYAHNSADQLRTHLNFLHEMGRVLDASLPAPHAYRSQFLQIMGITGSGPADGAWTAGQRAGRPVSAEQQFAMAFAYCAMYRALPSAVMRTVFWGYGFTPSARQYGAVCRLLHRL